ncbi:MAG: hypothetical protein ACKOA8_10525 [Deltaproteobacteria bacterium]
MKSFFFVLSLAVSVVFGAETPIVTKSTGSGFVMPSYQRFEMCKVFPNRVEITRRYGFTQTEQAILVEARTIPLQAHFNKLLSAVASEEIKLGNPAPCDIPTTTIEASGGLKLFFTGACGSKREERQGPASKMLMEIVGLYCPQTMDFTSGN